MLASRRYGTLYTGVTSHLSGRIWQHKQGEADGFTKKYGVKNIVWYEIHQDALSAITREKQIKKWNRVWKINLIQKTNPLWHDLSHELI
jgi:putative endonuclease